MPNWKKIIVSGSDASLNSLNVTTNVTASSFTGSFTGSLQGLATTASYVLNAISASYAATSSYANNFTVAGTLTAQTIVAQTVTSSTVFSSGSNRFGNSLANTQTFTGSVNITGSQIITGSLTVKIGTGEIQFGGGNGRTLSAYDNGVLANFDFNAVQTYFNSDFLLTDTKKISTQNGSTGDLYLTTNNIANAIKIDRNLKVTGSLLVSGSSIITGSLNVTQGITGSLSGSATSATSASYATTASYVLNAVSASYITTASYANNADLLDGLHASVFATTGSNQFNGNQVITGSLAVGSVFPSANSTENTLTVGLPSAGGAGEGGQILLQASGGLYTSASMIDNYQNRFRILRGTNAGSDASFFTLDQNNGQLTFNRYTGSGAFPGTATANLSIDSSGNVITTAIGSSLTGGAANYIARWASSTTLTTGSIYDNGTNVSIGNQSPSYKLDVSGDIRSTGAVYANANGAMYFRGGDDAELWDINIANTVGVYGQQNSTVGSIKLGSSGGIISGYSSSIGIGTTTPNNTLQVVGGITATSFTGSLFGTASYATTALTASYWSGSVPNATSASYAATASYVLGLPTGSSYAALVQSGSSSTWTFNHNLGYLYPVVTVYDANNNQIIPSQVSASSINQLQIIFSSARTGYATAVIGSATPTPATVNAYTSIGATTVTSVVTGSYNGAFWNYTAVSASNARAGQIMSVWSGSAITFSETTTNDIGNTSGLTFTASLSGGSTVLTAGSTTANWNIKLISTYL